MKILLISPTQSGIGGIAQHVKNLENFLEKNDNTVEIISSENTFTIPIKGLKNPSFMISSFLKTRFKKNFDIVHAHNIPSALAMKNSSGKKILTIHGIFSEQIDQLHGKTTGNISKKYEKNSLSWADAITVVSKEAYLHYSKMGFNVTQIPNAIDISMLNKNVDRRFTKQVIFVGRLSKEKGIDSLEKICKNLPNDIDLIILGTGPYENKIENLSKSKNNIHFYGYQPKEKTISLIRGSDVLIQPSLVEGISSTILESMACKTPVIASNVGGNLELIENKKNGFLVDPDNHITILENLIALLSDKKSVEIITENAFKTVQQYDWKLIGKKYLKLYSSLS